jgi:hypothetical protein
MENHLKAYRRETVWLVSDPVYLKKGLLNRNSYKSLSGAQSSKPTAIFDIFIFILSIPLCYFKVQ